MAEDRNPDRERQGEQRQEPGQEHGIGRWRERDDEGEREGHRRDPGHPDQPLELIALDLATASVSDNHRQDGASEADDQGP